MKLMYAPNGLLSLLYLRARRDLYDGNIYVYNMLLVRRYPSVKSATISYAIEKGFVVENPCQVSFAFCKRN